MLAREWLQIQSDELPSSIESLQFQCGKYAGEALGVSGELVTPLDT